MPRLLGCCILVLSVGLAAATSMWLPAPGPANAPPIADAGPDRVALEDQPVVFDGSRSSDPDGDAGGFSPSVKVDDATSGSQAWPDIAVGPDGAIHVAWEDGRRWTTEYHDFIYYAKSTDGGTTWSASMQVDDSSAYGKSYPRIAVGQDGGIHVAWIDLRNAGTTGFDAYYARSTDGGSTFGLNVRINGDPGLGAQEVPDLAVDPTGRVHAAWRDSRSLNYMDIYYANSTASAFGPNLPVNDVAAAAFPTAMVRVAADSEGTPHVVWEDTRNAAVGVSREDIYYATLNDDRTGFGANVRVTDDIPHLTGNAGHPSIAVGPDDAIYVSWMDLRDDPDPTDMDYQFNLYLSVSHDHGRTFGANLRLVDTGRVFAPEIAVDAAGHVHAVWRDGPAYYRGVGQLLYAEFSEDGTLLSGPIQVNDVIDTEHYEPMLALSGAGEPFVVWWENRSSAYDYDIYFARASAPSAPSLAFLWDFGDGATATGVEAEHSYAAPGEYLVTLTVTDAEGASDTDTAVVRIVEDPSKLLDELREAIANLPGEAFKSAGNSPPHRRQALLNKVDAVGSLVAAEAFGEALAKLRADLTSKWDGCAGGHAANDWVIDCAAQGRLLAIGSRLGRSLEALENR